MYLIDSADVEYIRYVNDIYNITGVTTNPTILCKQDKEFTTVLKEIESVIGNGDLHIQLLSDKYNDMIVEGTTLSKNITSNLHIKIPVSQDGFKAIKYLSNKGFSITATAVCNVNQALMAALMGADYIAVYVNRISNTGIDGNIVLKRIKEEYVRRGFKTKIIGAAYKNVTQVNESILNGADQVTIAPSLLEQLFSSEVTNESIKKFNKDIEQRMTKESD